MTKTDRQIRDLYLAILRFPLSPKSRTGAGTGADDRADRPLRLALDALNQLRAQERAATGELYNGGARVVLSAFRWNSLQDAILNTIATLVPILDRLDDLADKTMD
jgi:hypothetical protein